MSTGPGTAVEFPLLTDEQLAAVARRGTCHVTTAGEVLYRAGDRGYDFIVIEGGEVDLLRPAMPDASERRVREHERAGRMAGGHLRPDHAFGSGLLS